jgi:hypothetical protein
MKFKVNTKEIWANSYTVEAVSVKEAEDKVRYGSLGIDYFPTDNSKLAKPRAFLEYLEVKADS